MSRIPFLLVLGLVVVLAVGGGWYLAGGGSTGGPGQAEGQTLRCTDCGL